ncbi:hypothetical protein EV182_002846 [Spiromyces aspiralis]|uniref:Uncharacterized protein n=1 Tax=Spiromyces aspiralis TaxID=68401 RepID=A0ACC1HVC6_9FUNG|nr:hypothetical protein EV182_002846 [Spiromyces aspiralis]
MLRSLATAISFGLLANLFVLPMTADAGPVRRATSPLTLTAYKDTSVPDASLPVCRFCDAFQQSCSECNLSSEEDFLIYNTEFFGTSRALVGFKVSSPSDVPPTISKCTLHFPTKNWGTAFGYNVTFEIYQAASNNWDEATITGGNAPKIGDYLQETSWYVGTPSPADADLTTFCKNKLAKEEGVTDFSLFIEVLNRETGVQMPSRKSTYLDENGQVRSNAMTLTIE